MSQNSGEITRTHYEEEPPTAEEAALAQQNLNFAIFYIENRIPQAQTTQQLLDDLDIAVRRYDVDIQEIQDNRAANGGLSPSTVSTAKGLIQNLDVCGKVAGAANNKEIVADCANKIQTLILIAPRVFSNVILSGSYSAVQREIEYESLAGMLPVPLPDEMG